MSQTLYARAWRDHRGLTLEQASERAGMAGSTINRIETGKYKYTQHSLEALAHAYACEVSDLFQDPRAPGESEFERYVKKLDERRKRQAYNMLRAAFDDNDQGAA